MKAHQDDATDTAESLGRRIASGANDLMESAKEHASEYKGRAKDVLHEANNTSLADVEKRIGSYIKANPGRSIAGAAAAGFLLGFLLSRR